MWRPAEPAGAPHPGRWQSQTGDGRAVCELCPRRCHLKPGQRGFCYVRQGALDESGPTVHLDTYGRSSGFCIDPIEKKPLHHFYPGSPVLSFGTAGCNLGCSFCQNWSISKAKANDRLMERASPADIARAARRTGCKSVAYTYNDPVIFAEYAIDTALACREVGVKSVAVTAGYISAAARPDFFGAMDAANVDLKAFTERFYARLCYGRLEPIKETLAWLVHETPVWVELTTLLIPEENDGDAEIEALCQWVVEALGTHIPVHFSAYHPDFKLQRPRTPQATLVRARRIAQQAGLAFAYTGNVHDRDGGSTWCPGCGTLLVERDWYVLGQWGLVDGRCGQCQREIPGRWDSRPGTRGSKRERVRV